MTEPVSESTRRDAVKLGSGALLAALAALGAGERVAAQGASPVAGDGLEGQYAVLRLRKIKADRSAEELLTLIREGFVPLLQEIPGFISYVAVADPTTRDQFSIGVYADKAGADESTRRAAEWGSLGAAGFVEGDPIVGEGVIDIAVGAMP